MASMWLVLTDLSQTEHDYHTVLREMCNNVGLKPEQVLSLWGSPPCETRSPAGAVNQERGSRVLNMQCVSLPKPEHATCHPAKT